MRPMLAALLLLMIAGCSQAPAEPTNESSGAISEAPAESETLEPSPTPSQSKSSPQECSESTQSDIELVINAQVAAFGADDFELAYSYASPSFRANVGKGEFVQIIAGSYGPLIESSSLAFSDCLTNSDEKVGLLVAKFIQQSNEVYALRYLMVMTGDGWRVQGASNLQVIGEGA